MVSDAIYEDVDPFPHPLFGPCDIPENIDGNELQEPGGRSRGRVNDGTIIISSWNCNITRKSSTNS